MQTVNAATIKDWVIISEKVRRSVSYPLYSDPSILTAECPAELLSTLIDTAKEPFTVAAIMDSDEFFAFDAMLHSAPHKVEPAVHILCDAERTDINVANPRIVSVRFGAISETEFRYIVETSRNTCRTRLQEKLALRVAHARLEDMRQDQDALIKIGRSLQTEKDSDTLLRMILMMSKKITGADAGSIYIIEEPKGVGKQIRFKYSNTFSMDLPLEEFVIPFDTKSIAGYVAVTGTILNIPDVYHLSANDPVSFNASFDKSTGYRSKSMLVIPMRNHIDQIIGVIQLINSKEDPDFSGNEAFTVKLETPDDFANRVVPFDKRYEYLMEAVAGQAAIAIENNRMINTIRSQFEEFVKASVTAIESRDPATSGHSFRVADICVKVAKAISESTEPPYADIVFSDSQLKELEYAALLHDFGKVYTDLSIFMKSKKLFPKELENLLLRLDYLYRFVEMRYYTAPDKGTHVLERIRAIKEAVKQLNEPITAEDPEITLSNIYSEIREIECRDIEGREMEIFDEHSIRNLSIKRGSLNEEERKEIESHVVHTYTFVNNIPWPPEYENIPEIALRHHEKPDGTGYPNHEKGDDIILQARIMALADVYDALTSTDRPYKKSISHETAVDILKKEAASNKLDADVLDVFLRLPRESYTKKETTNA